MDTLIAMFFCLTLATATDTAQAVADGNEAAARAPFEDGRCALHKTPAVAPEVVGAVHGENTDLVLLKVSLPAAGGREVYTWINAEDPLLEKLQGRAV